MTERIEVRLYDTDGATLLAILDKAIRPTWQHELSRPGVAGFMLPLDDPKLGSVSTRRIIKFAWLDQERFACWVKAESISLVDGTPYVKFAGPGALDLLGDAVVFPEYGLARASTGTRRFGFMSKVNDWYKPDEWLVAEGIPWRRSRRAPKYPEGWPDREACWLRPPGKQSQDFTWFRTSFTTGVDVPRARLHVGVDDEAEIYLDGEPILTLPATGKMANVTNTADFPLAAGSHVLAAKITDATKFAGEGLPGEVMMSLTWLDEEGVIGDVIHHTTDTNSYARTDKRGEPGWLRGQILLRLLEEAANRGVGVLTTPGGVFSIDFDGFYDSDGLPWDVAGDGDIIDLSVNTGVTGLDEIVAMLTESRMDVDLYAPTMTIRAYRRAGDDRTAQRVTLRPGLNLHDLTVERESDLGTFALARMENGKWVTVESTATSVWGRIERGYTLGSTAAVQTAKADLTAKLEESSVPKDTITARPSRYADGSVVPYRDYYLGDTILVPGPRMEYLVPARVLSITVTQDDDGVMTYPELAYDRASSYLVSPEAIATIVADDEATMVLDQNLEVLFGSATATGYADAEVV